MTFDGDTTLSNTSLTELDEFLLADDERLNIDEAHGYVTALIVSKLDVAEADILDAVVGTAKPPERISGLLLAMYREIANDLASRKPFEPLVIEEEENGESFDVYEGWCFGFMLAVSEHEETWLQLAKPQQSLLEPIATLALLREEELDMDDEEYAGWVSLLPGSVNGLYEYWHNAPPPC